MNQNLRRAGRFTTLFFVGGFCMWASFPPSDASAVWVEFFTKQQNKFLADHFAFIIDSFRGIVVGLVFAWIVDYYTSVQDSGYLNQIRTIIAKLQELFEKQQYLAQEQGKQALLTLSNQTNLVVEYGNQISRARDSMQSIASSLAALHRIVPIEATLREILNPSIVKAILDEYAGDPKIELSEVSYIRYLDTLRDCNKVSKKWRGIHIGDVEPLLERSNALRDDDRRRSMSKYLESLGKMNDVVRIIIREKPYYGQDWITDINKKDEFIRSTIGQRSYWIYRETATELLRRAGQDVLFTMSDTAFYDDRLAIRFLPDSKMAAFGHGRIIFELPGREAGQQWKRELGDYWRLHELLEQEVHSEVNSHFHLVE